MNFIWKAKNPYDGQTFDILEWKKENVKFWLSKFPDIIKDVFKILEEQEKKYRLKEVRMNLPLLDRDDPVFAPGSIIKASLVFQDLEKKQERESIVFLPYPDPKFDFFRVNNCLYYLLPELADKPIVAYDKEIRIHSIRISKEGLLQTPTSNLKEPLYQILNYYGLTEKLGYRFEFFEKVDDTLLKKVLSTCSIYKEVTKRKYSKSYYICMWTKNKELQPFDKLVFNSLIATFEKVGPKKFDVNKKSDYIANLDRKFVFDPIVRILIGREDLPESGILKELLLLAIDEYNKNYKRKFISLTTKRVAYLDKFIQQFLTRLYRLREDLLRRTATLEKVCRFDPNDILRKLLKGNRFFQTPNALHNIFKEMDYRFKVLLCIENPADRQRSLDFTHLKRLDPIETPDRENIGVALHFAIHCKLDKFGNFIFEENEKEVVDKDE